MVPKLSGPLALTITVKLLRIPSSSQAWCRMSLSQHLGKQRQENLSEFEAGRIYLASPRTVRATKGDLSIKKRKQQPNKKESQVLRATVWHSDKTLYSLECLFYAVGD